MINQALTNIDRGITTQKIDEGWENITLYTQSAYDKSSIYAYKKILDKNIRYDNYYEVLQNTWGSISYNSTGELNTVITGSVNQFNPDVIIGVYSNAAHTQSAYLELFQLGYANINGSGSLYESQSINIYGDTEYIKFQQPKTLYNNIKKLFTTEEKIKIDNAELNDFVFLSIKNQYLFDGIQPQSLQFHLSKLDTTSFPIIDIEGPFSPYVFTDRKIQGTNIGYILSGSINSGSFKDSSGLEKKYGYIDYSSGIVIIDTTRLIVELGFTRGTIGTAPNESWKLPFQLFLSMYSAINGNIVKYNPSSGISNTPVGSSLALKSVQKINYTNYQCEIEKSEFNYSNNITYRDNLTNTFNVKKFVSSSTYQDNLFTGSFGTLYSSSNYSNYQNPESFITTVGLYSDTYDLIAVAKLSKPIRKNYDKKIIINVRLDF